MIGDAAKLAVGIDIGGTGIKVGVVNGQGQILARADRPTRSEEGVAHMVAVMKEATLAALAEAGLTLDQIDGVGAGAPGTVDAAQGVVVWTPNIGWNNVPLVKLLQDALGRPAFVDNDANCAALGEQLWGAGQGVDNMVLLTLGTGVGGGLIIRGRIYQGASGYAGEIGHMPMVDEGPVCGCGGVGCLEVLTAAPAIARLGRAAAASGASPLLLEWSKQETIEAAHVFKAADQGDSGAQEIVQQVAHHLGTAAASLINVLNPDMVVFGGGVSRAGETLLGPVRQRAQSRAVPGKARSTPIVQATLGNDAGLVGAAALVWQQKA